MILYHNHGWSFLTKILRLHGSVFARSLLVALPCAGLAVLLKYEVELGGPSPLSDAVDSLGELSGWNGFNVLVGFLVIFRTSQAYGRFWEGCHASYKMGAEWFSACSALISYCQYSNCEPGLQGECQNMLVRLFSMLYSAALGEIEEIRCGPCGVRNIQDIAAYRFELIDVQGIDRQSLLYLAEEESRVELIYQWVQNVTLHYMTLGALSIPPPILTRAFAELAAGLVSCHEAFKISSIPFPFPYAQTCDALLCVHWFMVPWVSCASCDSLVWAGIFTFVQVFILWSLDFIAIEIENPFGLFPNDLDTREMQQSMNRRLRLLMRPYARGMPVLRPDAIDYYAGEDLEDDDEGRSRLKKNARTSFFDAWQAQAGDRVLSPQQDTALSPRTLSPQQDTALSPRLLSPQESLSSFPLETLAEQPSQPPQSVSWREDLCSVKAMTPGQASTPGNGHSRKWTMGLRPITPWTSQDGMGGAASSSWSWRGLFSLAPLRGHAGKRQARPHTSGNFGVGHQLSQHSRMTGQLTLRSEYSLGASSFAASLDAALRDQSTGGTDRPSERSSRCSSRLGEDLVTARSSRGSQRSPCSSYRLGEDLATAHSSRCSQISPCSSSRLGEDLVTARSSRCSQRSPYRMISPSISEETRGARRGGWPLAEGAAAEHSEQGAAVVVDVEVSI